MLPECKPRSPAAVSSARNSGPARKTIKPALKHPAKAIILRIAVPSICENRTLSAKSKPSY